MRAPGSNAPLIRFLISALYIVRLFVSYASPLILFLHFFLAHLLPYLSFPFSGVARNFRQGVRHSVAFLSVHSRSAALPSRLSLTDKNIGTSARFYA